MPSSPNVVACAPHALMNVRNKFAMGVLDMNLEVLPVGPAETFNLKIDVPDFTKPKAGG